MLTTNQHKIGIILPVYNTEHFLPNCLDSILSQTYKNFVIYAIDDASTDNSLEILERYKKNDSRLKIIKKKKNEGLSAARNTGLLEIEQNETFDYVTFCDSDDALSPRFLEELLYALLKEGADIASCCFKRTHCNLKSSDNFINYCSYTAESFIEQIFSLGKWRNVRGSGGYVWLRLFDARKIKGVRFCEDKRLIEDELFCLEVATKISKITYIPKQLYLYRYRENSLCQQKDFYNKLVLSRLKGFSFAKEISYYSEIVAACAIVEYSQNLPRPINIGATKIIKQLAKKGVSRKILSLKPYLYFYFSFYLPSKFHIGKISK